MGSELLKLLEGFIVKLIDILEVPIKFLNALVDEIIEKRKFDTGEKRDIRESLLNTFSQARQGHWRRLPEPKDLAHLHKQINKIKRFDRNCFKLLRSYLGLWTHFIYLPKTGISANDQRYILGVEKTLSHLDDEACEKLIELR